ncbi:hypothetical protein ACFX11_002851 [Malus domestica]
MVASVNGEPEPDVARCKDPNLQMLFSAIHNTSRARKTALLKAIALSIIPSLNVSNVFPSSTQGILLQFLKGQQAAMQVFFVAAK